MTPCESIHSLLDVLDYSMLGAYGFLEPCRGTGNIYHAIDAGWKKHAELSEGIDYLTTPFADVDYCITNPPFSLALEFLEKSLAECVSVIYLLRLNFLGAQSRRIFWQANRPSHVMVLPKRPVFAWTCKGHSKPKRKGCGWMFAPGSTDICPNCGGKVAAQTDSIEYAWFAWDRLGLVTLDPGVHVL